MKNLAQKTQKINSALLDINRGYSIIKANGRDFYFRHFTLNEVLLMEEEYSNALEQAQKSGIKNEKELVAQAIKLRKWTKAKEEKAQGLNWEIEKLGVALSKTTDPHMQRSINNTINEKKQQIKDLAEARRIITGYSAESFAENRRVKFLIKVSCFADKYFEEEVKDEDLVVCSAACFQKLSEFNDREFMLNVSYLTSFFELFVLHHRQPHVIFKNAGLELTVFQKTLLGYANSLLNKFKNVTIPDEIAKDPVKVLEYDEKTNKTGKTSRGLEDLKEKAKARGGELKPEDFLT